MESETDCGGLKSNVAACLAGVAAAALWIAPARAAEFEPVIGLATLNGATGFAFHGAAGPDLAGSSVASAGDVNGDGFDDIIIGAKGVSSSAGSSYVVFGKAGGFTSQILPSTLNGSNGFRLDGVLAGDNSGIAVAGVGDVNGDGFADVAVGATGVNYGFLTNAGCTYVVFGKASGFASAVNLSLLDGTTGFKLAGAVAGDFSGRSVSSAGDVNGDGFADMIVGAYRADPGGVDSGSSYVVFGKAGGFASFINLSELNGTTGFRLDGGAVNDYSGISVSGAGDVNGDGFADLIIGAVYAAPNGVSGAGSSYVVFGKASGFASALALSGLNGTTGFRLDGVTMNDHIGTSVAGAGDVNGDGFADLLVGAYGPDPNGTLSGSSYVVFGKASVFASAVNLSTLNGTTGFRLDGVAVGDSSGISVSGAGDVNGDGFADLIVGAFGADPNGLSSGSSYVVFSKAAGFASAVNLSTLDGSTGFRLDGLTADDLSGISVSGAGDVNGDGFADVIVAAPRANPNGPDSGSSYVVFGRAPVASVIRAGAAADQRISGGPFTDFLWGVGGNDELEGRGGGDILDGSTGSNTASYRHAPGPISASLALPSANSGDAAGDIYSNIQNLEGSAFNDTLTGNTGVNTLTGGRGLDRLRGGKGKDMFRYLLASDSLPGAGRDQLLDFEPGTAATAVDKVDVSAIDANSTLNGNQSFTFRGTKPFSAAGQLRIVKSGANLVIQGNTGGTLAPDFEILLKGLASKIGAVTIKDFKP